jgi:Tfp pilus assembly protein PilV
MRGCHRSSRISDEAGFALMEALIGAVVLIVIAVATLGAIDRVQKTSAFAKDRSVAAALAEQDQARLRGLPTASLSTYRANHTASRAVTVNGLNYTVASTVDWLRDSTGGTPSCSNDGKQSDYLKLTSTVSANAIKPVTITSLASPPLAYSSSRGTLAVQVTDGAIPAAPVPGVSVTITGAVSMSDTTNELGCAVFSFIPAGPYDISIFKNEWVDEAGTATALQKSKTVVGGALALLPVTYDHRGEVTVKFETDIGSSSSVISPSRGWTASGFHTQVPGTQMRQFSIAAGAPPQASMVMSNLFPFRTAYQTFAGQCSGANPVNAIPSPTWFTTAPGSGDAIIVPPGGSGTVTVFQPPLKLTVRNGSSGTSPPVANANVVLTPKDPACSTKPILTTDASGRVSKSSFDFGSPYGTVAYDPGVPFGKYDVCIDAVISGVRRKYQTASTSPINMNSTSGPTPALADVNLAAAPTTLTPCS